MIARNPPGRRLSDDEGSPRPCDHPEALQQRLFGARDYISGDSFAVCLCRQCALARTRPQPPAGESDRYYPPEYYADARRYVFPIDDVLNRLQAVRSRRIHQANGGRAGKVLDVGCGRGLLLNQLRQHGWEVKGTELSDRAARFARTALQLDVRVGDLKELKFETADFDAVVLWHVLEHVPDPAALLHEVSRLLRPGGLLLVAAPNFGSAEARYCKDGWFHLDVPRHLSHFTLESLTRMLGAESLVPEQIGYFSPEYDFFSFVQSALNRLGLKHNSLYELLRAGPAKLLRRGERSRTGSPVLANLVLAPLLGVASLVVVPLAVLLRQGATMSVYARKVDGSTAANSAIGS